MGSSQKPGEGACPSCQAEGKWMPGRDATGDEAWAHIRSIMSKGKYCSECNNKGRTVPTPNTVYVLYNATRGEYDCYTTLEVPTDKTLVADTNIPKSAEDFCRHEQCRARLAKLLRKK